MRYWDKNIKISGEWIMYSSNQNDDNARANPNANQFEIQTQDILRNISVNAVGKAVLDSFQTSPNGVTIRPLAQQAVRKMRAGPTFPENARETDIGSPSRPGPGSSSTIWFSPGGVNVGGHFYRSDDSLLHESFHALRQVRGLWRAVPLPGWDNREEMYATMVTNIYASSTGRNLDIRSSHSSIFSVMQQTGIQFSRQFNDELLDFRTSMLDIHQRITAVKTNWNPLAEFESRFWNR